MFCFKDFISEIFNFLEGFYKIDFVEIRNDRIRCTHPDC